MHRSLLQYVNSIPRTLSFSLAALLLTAHVVLLCTSSWDKSPTYDEPDHLAFGAAYLEEGRLVEADAQRMPVTLLNALALKVCGGTPNGYRTDRRTIFCARLPTMIASLLLALGVFGWAVALYGNSGGLLALALYCFSPTVLGHARLVTNDLYTALAVFAASWAFWQLCRRPAAAWFLLSALTLGLAQACKFSPLVLVPAFGAILLFPFAREPMARYLGQRPARWGLVLFSPAVAFLALAVVYSFDGLFRPLEQFEFHSYPFAWLKAKAPGIGLPLPRVYLEGLDLSRYISTHPGVIRGHNYLFGRLSDDGWWYYYLAIGALKIPLGVLGLLALRCLRPVRSSWGTASGLSANAFLLVPALGIFCFFSLFSTVQLGIRYLLPVLPLLHVFAGGLLDRHRLPQVGAVPRTMRITVGALLLSAVISSVAAFPDYISYTGELAGSRLHAWRLMADSNLEWGQDRRHLQWYLERYPEAKLNPETPTAGHLVVRINFLTGVFHEERYRWLRENFQPLDTVRGSYLVYRITPGELAAVPPRTEKSDRPAEDLPDS